jgi:hypothetical protein
MINTVPPLIPPSSPPPDGDFFVVVVGCGPAILEILKTGIFFQNSLTATFIPTSTSM